MIVINITLKAIYAALPFRDAGKLHEALLHNSPEAPGLLKAAMLKL